MQSNTERISRYHLLIQSDHVGSYIVQLVLSMLLLMISTVNSVSLFSVFPIVTSSREIVMNFSTSRFTEEATAESPQRRKQKLKNYPRKKKKEQRCLNSRLTGRTPTHPNMME